MIRVIFLRAFLASGNEDSSPAPVQEPHPAPDTADAADLLVHPGADTIPAVAGLPCPADIPPVRMSDTETARVDALTRAFTGGIAWKSPAVSASTALPPLYPH